jgi:glycosyltransferase involved in cell wall biosynthesis
MTMRGEPMRKVLMTAFHFPPFHGSSGVQRTLKFVRYLPEHGWRPVVLSAWRGAYEETSDELLAEVDSQTPVHRAWALDAARHLAIKGKYLAMFERPDRWRTWALAAVPLGLYLARKHGVRALWSTYPITSAHLIAQRIQQLTGLPWIIDFRDNMVDADFPSAGPKRALYEKLEAQWVRAASRVVLTTDSARELCMSRHPDVPADKWLVIRNGYDEENFAAAERRLASQPRPARKRLCLVHSGLLVPSERNPEPFFDALVSLKRAGAIDPARVSIVLRGSGHDDRYRRAVESRGIGDLVELGQPVSHYAALEEMLTADALLLFQGRTCNHLVPAKLYEYMRAGRAVLALTDEAGEPASIMRRCGLDSIVDMESPSSIAEGLRKFLEGLTSGRAQGADAQVGAGFSRRAQATELAALLDSLQ